MSQVRDALELEEALRTRLRIDINMVASPDLIRDRIAEHLEDMVRKKIIPPECVILDLRGWCRAMAASISVELGTGYQDLSQMCRRIMAARLAAMPRRDLVGSERRPPSSEFLRSIGARVPAVPLSVEDEGRVEALKEMALRASLKPSLLDRIRDAKKVVEDAEEKTEVVTGFKRLVELD